MRVKHVEDADNTSDLKVIEKLKNDIIKSREMLIDSNRFAKNSDILLNGLSDVISKLSEFVIRLDLRLLRGRNDDN